MNPSSNFIAYPQLPDYQVSTGSTSSHSSDDDFLLDAGAPPALRHLELPAQGNYQPMIMSPSNFERPGGCWTCRIRKKGCDEQRINGSCTICRRLGIECLGWSYSRPDRIKDKRATDEFKAQIKLKMLREGRYRGHPVSDEIPPGPSAHSGQASNPRFTSLPPLSSPPTGSSSTNHSHNQFSSPAAIGVHNYPSTSSSSLPSQPYLSSMAPLMTPAPPPLQTTHSTMPSASEEQRTRDVYVSYYFNHVWQQQFPFASEAVRFMTRQVIANDLRGAVSNAVCALAGIHHSRVRSRAGQDARRANAMAYTFFSKAVSRIQDSKIRNGQYSEVDALAAVHLAYYSVCSGSMKEWLNALQVAREWLAATPLNLNLNNEPRVMMLSMTDVGKFAAKATMWLDIFASISLTEPPKFMPLYRRLLGSSTHHPNDVELSLESVTGCTNDVVLVFAETAALAHWKAQQLLHFTLTTRDLIRRGEAIESLLQIQASVPSPGSSSFAGFGSLSLADVAGQPPHGAGGVVGGVLRETALLYLRTVLNGFNTAVPEIMYSVASVTQPLNQLPPTTGDRSLLFPLCLAGCMTDDPEIRNLVKDRLQRLEEFFGVAAPTKAVTEAVWRQRDFQGGAVDWRTIMRGMGLTLLFV